MAAGTSLQPALHQHDVRRVDGDVRACADGDTDVRARQSRGVVDAVADHGHLAAPPELADHALLAVREDARDDLIHARLRTDGLGGALVIARHHDDIDAHILQLAYGLRAVWLDDVRHGDHAEQTCRQR